MIELSAGAGGAEAQWWCGRLLATYMSFCEQQRVPCSLLYEHEGKEPGTLRAAAVDCEGSGAFALLSAESGPHRFSRVSPFDKRRRRHTSFVRVQVSPLIEFEERELDLSEVRITTFRSSGPGGQHRNKTDSAVRALHVPTGLQAVCQKGRSQHENRRKAIAVLAGRLQEHAEAERREAQAREAGDPVTASFGSRIRSYVVDPTPLVKDHRSGRSTSRIDRVLAGDLNLVR